MKLHSALVKLRFKFSILCLLCMFIGIKSDPLFSMSSDSRDSSDSQPIYQKIFKRYPTCFPEQHREGYDKFIQTSEKDIKIYEGLYGRRVAPLIFFADELMNKGDFVLSGKNVDLQFFLPEEWKYSAQGRGGVIKTDDAIYSLSPEIFECLAQICFFLPAQKFLKTALTHALSKNDQKNVEENISRLQMTLQKLRSPKKINFFKDFTIMSRDRETAAKIKAFLEDLKQHHENGILFRDKGEKFTKFCLGVDGYRSSLESVLLYTNTLGEMYKKKIIGGVAIIAEEIDDFNKSNSLFLEQIPQEFKNGACATVKIMLPATNDKPARSRQIAPDRLSTTINLVKGVKSFSDKYSFLLMGFLSDFGATETQEHLDALAILSSASANLAFLEEQMQQILSKHQERLKK